MIDIKQKDSGAFGHFSNNSRKDANDVALIHQGFSMSESFDEVMQSRQQLEEGVIEPADSVGRSGLLPVGVNSIASWRNVLDGSASWEEGG